MTCYPVCLRVHDCRSAFRTNGTVVRHDVERLREAGGGFSMATPGVEGADG